MTATASPSAHAPAPRVAEPVPPTMAAIVHDRYGQFGTLERWRVDTPAPAAGEVLVRVRAAGLNVSDCFGVRGSPWPVRLATGLRRPRLGIPGYDLAGEVAAVGQGVESFSPGDAVFGAGIGTCAEFARARADTLAPMPAGLTPPQAAALPMAALAALHALRDAGRLQRGQRVLVNGASGGVGGFAVQIARWMGAEVTGVCSTRNQDLVRSFGAHQVIDYTREDFTAGDSRYDLILDNIENRALSDCRRVLAPDGVLILNSGTGATGLRFLVRLVWPLVLARFVRQRLRRYVSTAKRADLDLLAELAATGVLVPVIDSTYPLHETAAALAHVDGGRVRGKVVVTV
jgi:NADPH:quinone reductase-like Zn-dependent oxidoreductase